MPGSTDLAEILASLKVIERPEEVTVVALPAAADLPVGDGVLAVIAEPEGPCAVVTVALAERQGWPVEFRGRWLTLDVHTSLEGVGLTAVVASALAAEGIACNVLAGYLHDHLLVPTDRARAATAVLHRLRDEREA